ncbi:hypothetical protein [Nitrincola nitratireducens]|uniref:hypothetical protein n=1 Tax=Nitrincola nitratireducens TaxID=1229521 RepID=UPI0004AD3AE1|nr:hypothetical protein [Nitrincola nitratireducens]
MHAISPFRGGVKIRAEYTIAFRGVKSVCGTGAVNMVTAAAVEHVNPIPVLFLLGDTFATF